MNLVMSDILHRAMSRAIRSQSYHLQVISPIQYKKLLQWFASPRLAQAVLTAVVEVPSRRDLTLPFNLLRRRTLTSHLRLWAFLLVSPLQGLSLPALSLQVLCPDLLVLQCQWPLSSSPRVHNHWDQERALLRRRSLYKLLLIVWEVSLWRACLR